MLVHVIAAALPLVLAGGEKGSTGSSDATANEKTSDKVRDDSLPSASGAEGQGGLDSKEGEGRQDDLAAGEAGDSTSGAESGRWDRSGGRSARETPDGGKGGMHGEGGKGGMHGEGGKGGMHGEGGRSGGHAGDKMVRGRLSAVSGDEITIRSRAGEQKLKIVPQTVFTLNGKEAQRSQLKEGLPVRASFMEHGGEQVAVRIEAGRRAEAPRRPARSEPSGDAKPPEGTPPVPQRRQMGAQ
jgi:hypothetical protein